MNSFGYHARAPIYGGDTLTSTTARYGVPGTFGPNAGRRRRRRRTRPERAATQEPHEYVFVAAAAGRLKFAENSFLSGQLKLFTVNCRHRSTGPETISIFK